MTFTPVVHTTGTIVVQSMPQLDVDGITLNDACGIIPWFVADPDKPLIESLTEGYGFGWRHMDGFVLNKEDFSIAYKPGQPDSDPPLHPWAKLFTVSPRNNDTAYIYQYGWVLVLREDGTFEISRMD